MGLKRTPILGEMFGQWRVVCSNSYYLGEKEHWKVYDGFETKLVSKSNLLLGKSTRSNSWRVTDPLELEKKRVREILRIRQKQTKRRCNNPKAKQYCDYGGKGIEFRFRDFEDYFEYVTSLENFSIEKQLDRIDNNGHYERGNLRWVTASENCKNKSNNIKVVFNGEEMCFSDFVKHCQISWCQARKLLKKGLSPEEISRIDPSRNLRHIKRRQ
jgi:hypothetical protein